MDAGEVPVVASQEGSLIPRRLHGHVAAVTRGQTNDAAVRHDEMRRPGLELVPWNDGDLASLERDAVLAIRAVG